MSKLTIGRCGLRTDNINAGVPFWFDGSCVGRLAVNDDVSDNTMYLVVGSEIDDNTFNFIIHCAKRLAETSDPKVVSIGDNRATFVDEMTETDYTQGGSR